MSATATDRPVIEGLQGLEIPMLKAQFTGCLAVIPGTISKLKEVAAPFKLCGVTQGTLIRWGSGGWLR
jgi:hypothetical protein